MKKFVVLCSLYVATLSVASEPLVVHEWGTFTVLQDAHGNPVPGVNINEESLPPFVHKLAANLAPDSHELGPLIGLGPTAGLRSKGIKRYYHAALMRMETPIIYLYPPKDEPARPIDLQVQFKGGWITEWFPNAAVDAPGYKPRHETLMKDLSPETVGRISWNGLRVKPGAQSPQTDFPVWLAPRATEAPALFTPEGEVEDYLFYRGVANLEGPLRVTRNDDQFEITPNPKAQVSVEAQFPSMKMWLVHIDAGETLRFRTVKPGWQRAFTDAEITAASSEGDRLALRAAMKSMLVDDGLFEDEAEAMLNTWEVSYFRTPGLRLFFNLPQSWTDAVLPLSVSGYDTEVKRAMIGRVELVSDRQRTLLKQIAEGPVSNSQWFHTTWWMNVDPLEIQARTRSLVKGETTLEDYGMKIPPDYQAYMELGRFRDALVLHEVAQAGNANLKQFALNYGLPVPR